MLLKTLVTDEAYGIVESVCGRDEELSRLCRAQDESNPLNRANRKSARAAASVEEIRLKRERLYEDYASGILTAEDYIYMKEAYTKRAEQADTILEQALNEEQELKQRLDEFHKRAEELTVFCGDRTFSRELVERLIERIYVSRDNNIRVISKFSDMLAQENTMEGNTP